MNASSLWPSKERRYIQKRKLQAMGTRLLFSVCGLLPIKNNRIAVCSFEGRGGFGCNPKYVIQALHRIVPNCEIIWFVNDMGKEFPEYIKKVPNTLGARAYYLSTSRVWLDNYRKPYGTKKRRRQYYVNTWHANMGFKTIGLLRGDAFSEMAYLVSKNDSDMIDHVVIDSTFCEVVFRKGLLYDGAYLKIGQPRCDILYGDRSGWITQLRQRYHLSADAKIILYAPTFREGAKDGKRMVFSQQWSIDFPRMLEALHRRFSGTWYLFTRLHPQLAAQIEVDSIPGLEGRVVDVSREDDLYEILAGVDGFLTDYSSAAMDASFCGMPVFLYADDITQYRQDRGNLLWNLQEDTSAEVHSDREMLQGIDVILPYPVAKNNDELEQRILTFDEALYEQRMEQFAAGTGLIFDGQASEKLAEEIKCHMRW